MVMLVMSDSSTPNTKTKNKKTFATENDAAEILLMDQGK